MLPADDAANEDGVTVRVPEPSGDVPTVTLGELVTAVSVPLDVDASVAEKMLFVAALGAAAPGPPDAVDP